jgi:hypothetical protein
MIIALSLSCKKELGSDLEYRDMRFEVKQQMTTSMASFAGINIPINLPMFDVTIPFSESGEIDDPYLNLIEDIYLKSMKMTIVSPDNITFSFVEDFQLYISNDTYPEIKLAHHFNASPDIGNVLYFAPDKAVLDNYMKNGEYTLRTELVADELIFQDLEIEVLMTFDVKLVNQS